MNLSLVKGAILFIVTGLGLAGNVWVLVNAVCSCRGDSQKTSVHLILTHLALTNVTMLLAKGVPSTVAVFGFRNFLDDVGCKSVVYLERVARDLSVCCSSLLAVVQAITISPRGSVWRRLKPKTSGHSHALVLIFWILTSLKVMNFLHSIRETSANTSQISKRYTYCSFLPESQKVRWSVMMIMVLYNAAFQGVMGGASGYLVCLLHRHHQHVLYLQNSKLLHRTPPELRAAQSVLLLMLCFLFFFWMNCVFSMFLNSLLKNNFMMLNTQQFLTLGYAVVSPFVLIHRGRHLDICRAKWERKPCLNCLFS